MDSTQSSRVGTLFWNLLTLLTLIGVILVVLAAVYIFQHPNSPLNPFPPEALPEVLVLPTATPTLRSLPATWTPTIPQATETPQPTATIDVPLVTVTAVEGEFEVTAEPTDQAGYYAFELKSETVALDGKIFHPDWECNWLGAAGQVEDLQGRPAKGLRVVVGGSLNGSRVDMNSLTGTALQYGPSGYEFKLADEPVATEGKLWVQLVDQAGLPLSARVTFDTVDACDKNLILINFHQVR